MLRHLFVTLVAALIAGAALAQRQALQMSGPARLFAPDAIIVGDNTVAFRLWGVDAPEPGQPCWIEQLEWACADDAFEKLEDLIAGKTVTCALRQDGKRRGSAYAVCRNADGVDLALAMVEAGFALAVVDQTTVYVAAEQAAENSGVGMWQGAFQEPWVFRERQRGGN